MRPAIEPNEPTRRELLQGCAALVAITSLAAGCSRRSPEQGGAQSAGNLPRTDPALVRYRETSAMTVSIPSPRGVCVDSDGLLWVAGDGQAALVSRQKDSGSPPRVIRFEGAADCVAWANGSLLLGIGNRVVRAPSDGSQVRPWLALEDDSVVTCIAAGQDDVLVADAGKRRIVRCDRNGHVRGYLCEKDEPAGYTGLIIPSPHLDVVVDAENTVHVVNPGKHVIEIRDMDGPLRWSWGEASEDTEGFCGCCNPTDIALLPDGGYVTAEKGIPRVKVYSKEGHFESLVAGPEHLSPGVVGLDLTVLPDGTIAVLDPPASLVRLYRKKEGT